jgi:hypothetical protein
MEQTKMKNEKKNEQKRYVIQLNGGIGKAICATSFISWLYDQGKPEITVISAWPEIFERNPKIHRNLPLNQAYLFEDYIRGKDYRVGEPYHAIEYYRDKNKKHIMEVFPKSYSFDGKCSYDTHPSEIILTEGELAEANQFAMQGQPIITLQATGGVPQGGVPNPSFKLDNSQRDMFFEAAKGIVKQLTEKGFRVLQICQKTEPKIEGCIHLDMPFRKYVALIPHIKAHIGIDSSFMHACGAFKTPQLVFWGQTHVDNLGYQYPGTFNKWKKGAMECRPHVAMPDNAATMTYPANDKAMDWTVEEVTPMVEELLKYLQENSSGYYNKNIPLPITATK